MDNIARHHVFMNRFFKAGTIKLWLKNQSKVYHLDIRDKQQKLIIFIFYSIAHSLIIFNNGIFWDDWVFIDSSKEVGINIFKEVGLPWFSFLVNLLFLFDKDPLFLRTIIFLTYFFTAICLYSILKNIKEPRENGKHEIMKTITGMKYPIKIIFEINESQVLLITAYPLKRGSK